MNDVIQKMMMDMQVRGLCEESQKEYVRCVEVFELFHGKPITEVTESEIKEFLHYLISQKRLSVGTVNIYNSALRFLYEKTLKRGWNSGNIPRLKQPKKLPDVLTKEDVHESTRSSSNESVLRC